MKEDGAIEQKPVVVAVSGVKNSGKTTLLCGIIPLLRAKGLRVAVVKHDGHEFDPDMPDTDSYKLRGAGAQGVSVYSKSKYMLVREQADVSPEELFVFFSDMDLILLEGGKSLAYPRIEVVRAAVSSAPVCDPATLLAVCTDAPVEVTGVRCVALEDYPAAAKVIEDFYSDAKKSADFAC